MIADSLPYWPINPVLTPARGRRFQLDMARCLWAILPAAILWGASFPLALAAVTHRAAGSGRWWAESTRPTRWARSSARWRSAWRWFPGSGRRIRSGCCWCCRRWAALVVLVPVCVERPRARDRVDWLAVALIVAGFLAWRVDPVPGELIAYGRRMPIYAANQGPLYHRGPQLLGGDHAMERRRDRSRCQRPRGSHHRTLRHEAAAHGGPSAGAAASRSEIGAGNRIRRGRFRRHFHALSRHAADHRLRDRAGDSAHLHPIFRQAGLRGATTTRGRTWFSTTRAITC